MNISAIILAAGLSRRMGRNKLLLPFEGVPLLQRCLNLIASIKFYQNILVTTRENLQGIDTPPEFTLVFNPRPEDGQSSSLRLGLEAADGDGYLFMTADQPFLDAETIERILAEAAPGYMVIPRCRDAGGGERTGSPALFSSRFRGELLDLRGDGGGRALFLKYPELCRYAALPSVSPLLDVDTPEDYENLASFSI